MTGDREHGGSARADRALRTPPSGASDAGGGPDADPRRAGRQVSRRRRAAARVAQAAIVAASAYFLAAYLARSWGSIQGFDWRLDLRWLVASGLVFLAYYFAQAGLWWLLLRGCGVRSPSWPAASVWGKSILARYVPGNVFMFVGRAWMSHSQGHAVERVTAAMLYEQALGVCGALLAVAALFPFWEYRPGATALSLLALPFWWRSCTRACSGRWPTASCVSPAARRSRSSSASAPCWSCSACSWRTGSWADWAPGCSPAPSRASARTRCRS